MDKPLLSICIPTYNRADFLKQTIESIIHQPEFLDGKVEIVVSDNASTDKTHEVCKEYNMYSNFFYHRNIENIMDQNFPMVLSKAHGKLRKLNNDTFVLGNNALKELCELVELYNERRPYIYLKNEAKEIKEYNFHDFVVSEGFWITWIGSFTIWEDECDNIDKDVLGCELKLWQVKKICEIAYKKDLVVVCCKKIGESISPPKKDISYGLYKVFYCNYMELLEPYVENGSLSNQDISYLEKQLLFDFFLPWMVRYELNCTDMQFSKEENLKFAVFNQYREKPYWKEFEKKYNKKLFFEKTKLHIKGIR